MALHLFWNYKALPKVEHMYPKHRAHTSHHHNHIAISMVSTQPKMSNDNQEPKKHESEAAETHGMEWGPGPLMLNTQDRS